MRKLLFLIAFAFLLAMPLVNAYEIEKNPSNLDGMSGSTADYYGMVIIPLYSGTIVSINKTTSDNSLTGYLLDSAENILASGAFVGDKALINYEVVAGTKYFIVGNADGNSVTHSRNTTPVLTNTTYINWTAGYSAIEDPTQANTIQSLEFDAVLITLVVPTDNSYLISSQIFNANINLNPTNATLYIWNSTGIFNQTTNYGYADFDGVDDYVDLGDVLDMTGKNLTATLWLWLDKLPSGVGVVNTIPITRRQTSGSYLADWGLEINTAGKVVYSQFNSGWETLTSNTAIGTGEWVYLTMTHNTNTLENKIYINGVLDKTGSTARNIVSNAGAVTRMAYGFSSASPYTNGSIFNVQMFNKTLTPTEITTLYNTGRKPVNPITNGLVGSWNLQGNYLDSSGQGNNGTNYGSTLLVDSIWNISNFRLGNYDWNVYGCSDSYCDWAVSNYSFVYGYQLDSLTYDGTIYETANQTISSTYNIVEGAGVTSMFLVYNGINYSISDFTQNSTSLTMSMSLDTELLSPPFVNASKEFWFKFNMDGVFDVETEHYYQNVSYINLQLCNATYNIHALNFTLMDELTSTEIDADLNRVTYLASFKYWLGNGDIYKNYSYQVINNTNSSFNFCIYPYPSNWEFKTEMDSQFSATDYSENNYYLRSAILTNNLPEILLYLLPTAESTKFYVNVKSGVSYVAGAIVTVSKYFIGEGIYKTIATKLTDTNGQFSLYADIDSQYRFNVVKDGEILGVVDKTASCEVAPCSIDINLESSIGSVFEGYYDVYTGNVYSNLSFDSTTKIVTYNFVDITGLANYFRLDVQKISYNGTLGETICNNILYSSSGSLTCNMTGHTGDFKAYGYISRSPEKIDKFISFLISDNISTLGILGLLLNVAIILTLVMGSAVVSRGSPSAIMVALGLGVLLLKLIDIFPFSWAVVVTMEAILVFIIIKAKT